MTIPQYILDWLKANGFERKLHTDNPYEIELGYHGHFNYKRNDTDIIEIYIGMYNKVNPQFQYELTDPNREQYKQIGIPIPSNEQDFLTLMNILLK